MKSNLTNRTIYCKDNLDVLKGINSNTIDLIYLDPPFNKQKIFTAPIGSSSEGASFKDLFRLEDLKDEWIQEIKEDYDGLYKFLSGIKELSNITGDKKNKHYLYNYCYLCYMAVRLIELKRILKESGSIYLHCDNTMGHYLKILMDIIFSEKNFLNSIVWWYETGGIPKKDFSRKHDIILRYSKTNNYLFFSDDILEKRSDEVLRRIATGNENATRSKGEYRHPSDVFKISGINAMAKERTGYPTQKPIKLLERIIKASSKKGDLILDPFCGCATTCVASEKLERQWVGIDISYLAYELVKDRLKQEVNQEELSGQLDLLNYDKLVNFTTVPPKRTDGNGDDTIIKKYVYIISHPKHKGFYKVGIASNYTARLNSYQTGDPKRSYKLEYYYLTPYFREIEKHVHSKFNNLLEWVQASKEEIIKEIEGYYGD